MIWCSSGIGFIWIDVVFHRAELDPALHDEDLRRKLGQNRALAKSNMDEVCVRYCCRCVVRMRVVAVAVFRTLHLLESLKATYLSC